MFENENIVTGPIEDDDTILPDGWAEGDDIFADDEWTDDEQADESAAEPENESDEGSVEETDDSAPTTEQENVSDDSGETQEEAPTTEPETEVKPNTKHKFKATFDREEREVEIDLDADLPTIWQKAQVTERVQAKLANANPKLERAERLARSLGYDNFEAMLTGAEENYIDSEVKRLTADGGNEEMAKFYVKQKMEAEAAKLTIEPDDKPDNTAQPAAANKHDPRADFNALIQARPDLAGKPIPREVLTAYGAGKNLLAAYTDYEVRQAKAEAEKVRTEAAKVRKENEIYKQNAASAAKAPVKGVSGGGATDTKPKDPFEEGFDSDYY